MTTELDLYTCFMLDFVQEAGALALAAQERAQSSMKADNSVVTEADLAISKLFHERLAALPNSADHFAIDEETVGTLSESADALSKARCVWILDPIDGTLPYSTQMPLWGIYLSLYIDRQPVLGVIALPALREMIYTDGKAAYHVKNDDMRRLSPLAPRALTSDTVVFATRSGPFKQTVKYFGLYCAAIFAAFTMLGRSQAGFFGGKMKIWDVAAVPPIAKHLGLALHDIRTGAPMTEMDLTNHNDDWSLQNFWILCHPSQFADFQALVPDETRKAA